jgi:hypothetical protein
MMHAGPEFVFAKVGFPALLILGVLGVLFCFQKTRSLGGVLLGVIALALLFGIAFVDTRVRLVHSRADHTYAVPPQPVEALTTPLDMESLLAPRIQLEGHAGSAEVSAHPAQPLHTHEADPSLAASARTVVEAGEVTETIEASPADASHVPDDHVHDNVVESVAPKIASSEPPPWVAKGPHQEGGSRFAVVVTDPFSKYSLDNADRQLTQLVVIASSEVASDLVGVYGPHYYPPDAGPNPNWTADIGTRYWYALEHLQGMLTPGTIRNKVLRETYVEDLDLDLPSGPMIRVHALLEFDEPFQRTLQERWQQAQAQKRLGVIGVIAAGVLGFLGLVWGVLKFDTATKGYYTKRLIVGGVLVTIAVIGFFIVAA